MILAAVTRATWHLVGWFRDDGRPPASAAPTALAAYEAADWLRSSAAYDVLTLGWHEWLRTGARPWGPEVDA